MVEPGVGCSLRSRAWGSVALVTGHPRGAHARTTSLGAAYEAGGRMLGALAGGCKGCLAQGGDRCRQVFERGVMWVPARGSLPAPSW